MPSALGQHSLEIARDLASCAHGNERGTPRVYGPIVRDRCLERPFGGTGRSSRLRWRFSLGRKSAASAVTDSPGRLRRLRHRSRRSRYGWLALVPLRHGRGLTLRRGRNRGESSPASAPAGMGLCADQGALPARVAALWMSAWTGLRAGASSLALPRHHRGRLIEINEITAQPGFLSSAPA